MRISHKNVNSRRTQGDQPPSSQRAQALNCINFSFPKSSRILKRKHFKEIGNERRRYFGEVIVIDYRPAEKAKLGLTVVRRFGNAVLRNRFKRRVREAFRTQIRHLMPNEMIVMPRKGIESFSLELITKDLLDFNHDTQSRAAKSR